jgi:hypothetical protein
MFFQSWWQGIIFGFVTTVAMLAVCYAFALSWKKYEGQDKKPQHDSCNAHH